MNCRNRILTILTTLAATSLANPFTTSAAEPPRLLWSVSVAGDAEDLSGITGRFPDGTAKNQLGGFSAITPSATPNRYLFLPDRGPNDGEVDYPCRFHEMELILEEKSGAQPKLALVATHMLRGEVPITGSAAAWDPNKALRLDPEGIRVLPDGNLLISDEYGPHLLLFSPEGKLLKQFAIPDRFKIKTPGLTKKEENKNNTRGRQGNGGMEGLAISNDGRFAYAMMQGPLLQDHAFDDEGEDLGVFLRIVQVELASGAIKEFCYPMEGPDFGISEVLADDDGSLLVVERDSKPGIESKEKAIFRIRLDGASDISNVDSLPATELPSGITPVTKEPFLDLLAPAYGLVATIPPKIEGLAWGPELENGEKLLIVASDNDFETANASMVYFFAVPLK